LEQRQAVFQISGIVHLAWCVAAKQQTHPVEMGGQADSIRTMGRIGPFGRDLPTLMIRPVLPISGFANLCRLLTESHWSPQQRFGNNFGKRVHDAL